MELINMDEYVLCETQGHSSKGNQLKWKHNGYWYKADHMGYEGLAEVITSKLLRFSSVTNYVEYEPALIQYKRNLYNGCKSKNFLAAGEELITVDKLFRQYTGLSLTVELAHITSTKERILYLVENVKEITRLSDFDKYMTMTLEMDAFFLNEDRHTNNIAVIYNSTAGTYRMSPLFDNGLALFADTSTDFSIEKPISDCFHLIQAKPFSNDFEDQMDEAVSLYGNQLKLNFNIEDMQKELTKFKDIYESKIIIRVEEILRNQMRKYQYLFKNE